MSEGQGFLETVGEALGEMESALSRHLKVSPTPIYMWAPTGGRKQSRRRHIDSWLPSAADLPILGFSTSKRSASFGFSIVYATQPKMCLLNVRTREVVRVVRRGPVMDFRGVRTLRTFAWVERAVQKGILPAGEPVELGDEWLILGLDEHLVAHAPIVFASPVDFVRKPYSIEDHQ